MSTSLWKLDFPPSIIGGLAWVVVALFLFLQAPEWLPYALVLGIGGGYFVLRAYRIAKGLLDEQLDAATR